jgi:hypothetical protein
MPLYIIYADSEGHFFKIFHKQLDFGQNSGNTVVSGAVGNGRDRCDCQFIDGHTC